MSGLASEVHVNRKLLRSRSRPVGLAVISNRGSSTPRHIISQSRPQTALDQRKLECGPMPNVMAALPNIGGALGSTPQSLADAH